MQSRSRIQRSFGTWLMATLLIAVCTSACLADGVVYKALSDFPNIEAGEVPYYKDTGHRQALAIRANIVEYREKFARAVRPFDGTSAIYDVTITTVQEEDGESTFRLVVNGEIVAEFQNPYIGPGSPANDSTFVHVWKGIAIKNGDEIGVESNTHTNGELPEPGGTAWSRGRWRQIELTLIEKLPVAHLKFEGNVLDEMGNIDVNDPNLIAPDDVNAPIEFLPGIDGLALALDGQGQHVALGASLGNNVLKSLTSFSSSVWINPTTGGMGDFQRIWQIGANNDQYIALLPITGGSADAPLHGAMGGPRFEFKYKKHPDGLGNNITINGPNVVAVDEWSLLVATLDAETTTASIYVNGELIVDNNNVPRTPSMIEEYAVAQLGAPDPSKATNNFYAGMMDELKFYDFALSAEEIAAMVGTAPALANHWALDEDTAAGATVAVDSIGGADGIINGAESAAGVYGNAMLFSGVGTQIDVNDFSTASIKSMTCMLWMNPAAGLNTAPEYKRVFSAGDHWEIVLQPNTGEVGNNFYRKGGKYPITTAPLAEGEWTHVAMTSDLKNKDHAGSGLMTIYINGELDAFMPGLADDNWGGGLLLIGNRPGKVDKDRYKGLLDDIRIYDGVLTPSQIQTAMNGE